MSLYVLPPPTPPPVLPIRSSFGDIATSLEYTKALCHSTAARVGMYKWHTRLSRPAYSNQCISFCVFYPNAKCVLEWNFKRWAGT